MSSDGSQDTSFLDGFYKEAKETLRSGHTPSNPDNIAQRARVTEENQLKRSELEKERIHVRDHATGYSTETNQN